MTDADAGYRPLDDLLNIGSTVAVPVYSVRRMCDCIRDKQPRRAAEAATEAARYFERMARSARKVARTLRHMEGERC